MKRILSFVVIFSMFLGFAAFQCSSTEITSAKLYIQQKNLPKAKESLEKEIAKNPKSDEGYYLLGYVLGEQGNISEMIKNFEKSLSISSKFAKDIDNSRKYYWQESFNKGVGMFNKGAKAANPDSGKVFYEKAIQSFKNAIMCEPDSASTYKNLSFAYLSAGKKQEAIEPLKKIIALDKSVDAYVMLGELYFEEGNALLDKYSTSKDKNDSLKAMEEYAKTINLLEEGRKLHGDNSDLLMILSNAYINANKLDIAMDAFAAGVKKDPNNKYYRYNYGVLLLGANKFEEAVEQFQKAIEIDPSYSNASYNLGVTYLKWGTYLREKSIEKNEEDRSYLEKFKLALDPLKKYLEINPEDFKVWDFLGKVYANLGMTNESKEAFDKADQYRK